MAAVTAEERGVAPPSRGLSMLPASAAVLLPALTGSPCSFSSARGKSSSSAIPGTCLTQPSNLAMPDRPISCRQPGMVRCLRAGMHQGIALLH